jgi:YbbR domain-containing protein
MKFKPFIERIIHNWPAKVICLALALVLYFFYQLIALEHKNIPARLTVQNGGIMLPASAYDNSIRVTFRGRRNDIAAITENDFSVFLDFSYYTTEGVYNVPVKIQLNSELMKLDPLEIHLSPDIISLKIEPREYAEIPLKPMLRGDTADGYEAGAVRLMPSSVRVSGPKSMVKNLQSLPVEEIALDERSASFTAQVKIINASSFIRVERDEPVNAEVAITEKINTQSFPLPITAINMPTAFTILETSPTVVEANVSAPQFTLDRFQISDASATIDYSALDGDGISELPITITLPAGFTLVSQTPETVTVTAMALDTDVN